MEHNLSGVNGDALLFLGKAAGLLILVRSVVRICDIGKARCAAIMGLIVHSTHSTTAGHSAAYFLLWSICHHRFSRDKQGRD